MTERGQRNGRVDNNEGWCGMVQYMPGSRERLARHDGGVMGGRKAVRGHIHSIEQLRSFGLPSTMNVLRRTLHCEHTLRLQFLYLPAQKSGQLLLHEKQRVGVPNTRKGRSWPAVMLEGQEAALCGGWNISVVCPGSHARSDLWHAEVSCLWSKAVKSFVSAKKQDLQLQALGVPQRVRPTEPRCGFVPHVAPTLSCACPSSTASCKWSFHNNLCGNCIQLAAASSLMGRLALMWMFPFLGVCAGVQEAA